MDNIQYKEKERNLIQTPIFNGRTVDRMPELVSKGYTPISIAGIMDLRNDAFKSGKKDLIQQVCYNYSDSGDGIIYNPYDGKIKIDLDSQNLRVLTLNVHVLYESLETGKFYNNYLKKLVNFDI